MALFSFDHDDDIPKSPLAQHNQTQGAIDGEITTEFPRSMDIVLPKDHSMVGHGTPPMKIASPLPKRAMHLAADIQPQVQVEKLDFDAVMKKAQKKKKKKRAMKPGAPAATTIRGFQTPVTSGGEESDFSVVNTPRLGPISGFPSVTSSPALRPTSAAGGITNLKQQLEALNLGSRMDSPLRGFQAGLTRSGISSNASISGLESDSDRTEMESYEVNLESDFISPDVPSKTSTMTSCALGRTSSETYMRKMTAEDFEPLTCLGKGSYGTVLLVRQRATGRL